MLLLFIPDCAGSVVPTPWETKYTGVLLDMFVYLFVVSAERFLPKLTKWLKGLLVLQAASVGDSSI